MNPRVQDWHNRRVWVIGASGGLGAALTRALLARGARVAMSARRVAALEALALGSDPARVCILPLDVTHTGAAASALDWLVAAWGGVDIVLFCAGTHRPARAWDCDAQEARTLFDINVLGCTGMLSAVIPLLLRQGQGGIGVVSSVAGYRSLPTAFLYGATKAALTLLAEGLYLDLAPRGIAVWLINPGFVKTPLTDRNRFHMPGLMGADEAAEEILRGMERGRFEIHFPRRFTLWLKLLRLLPYRLYFPLIHRLTGL